MNTKHSTEKPTLSVVLMIRDHKHEIEGFFRTIEGLADELILLDTGSTDGSLDLVDTFAKSSSFSVKVFHRFGYHTENPTRQFGVDQAESEYVFQLDADERLTDAFRQKLKPFLREHQPDVVNIPRIDELVPHLHDIMVARLFRKNSGAHFEGGPLVVHPFVRFSATPLLFPEAVLHMQGRDHWLRRPHRIFTQLGREVEAEPNTRGLLREMYRGMAGFYYKFRKTYYQQGTRQDGKAGFKFAMLKGLYVFLFHLFVGLKPRESENK